MALLFNGTTDYLTVPTPTNLYITGNMSVLCWIQASTWTSGTYRTVLNCTRLDTFAGYYFPMVFETAGNAFQLNYFNSVINYQQSANIVPLDANWHSAGWTINGTGAGAGTFYFDGVAQGTWTHTAPGVSNQDMGIAAWPDGTIKFLGALSHLTVWNSALTGPQVASYHAGVNPTTIGSPLSCWKMIGGSLVDSGSNGYTAVVHGSPTTVADPSVYAASGGAAVPVKQASYSRRRAA